MLSSHIPVLVFLTAAITLLFLRSDSSNASVLFILHPFFLLNSTVFLWKSTSLKLLSFKAQKVSVFSVIPFLWSTFIICVYLSCIASASSVFCLPLVFFLSYRWKMELQNCRNPTFAQINAASQYRCPVLKQVGNFSMLFLVSREMLFPRGICVAGVSLLLKVWYFFMALKQPCWQLGDLSSMQCRSGWVVAINCISYLQID